MITLEIINIEDSLYPSRLKNIKNPPKALYAIGNVSLLNSNIFSIIGSRSCSDNGFNLAKKFAKELSYQDLAIASGMALGIDTAAHLGTLEQGGKTIAVLANGFNHIFPPENLELFNKIIKNEGLVITEYPPEVIASSSQFLARNRIVSGLSLGILVVEAAYRSGTSVTAKFAIKQGRKVFALPHELTDIHGVGTNRLIKNGAKIVTNTEDILSELSLSTYKKPPIETKSKISPNIEIAKIKKECNNSEYNKVYKFINSTPISLNELCKNSNKNISDINNILLMLELEGFIEKGVDGYTCIFEKK